MVLKSQFRGFIVPVFAPYNNEGEVNVALVSKYAKHVIDKKVPGILVNGTAGEGLLMTLDERKALLEAWIHATKNTGVHVMVHVGGANLKTTLELAKHAESVGVNSLLCFPDLMFRPNTVEDLVSYLKLVGAAAPKTPLFYYNYPLLTGVKLDMVKFLELGSKEIPTLCGMKYTDTNLEESYRCVQFQNKQFAIYLGCDQLVFAALCMGFDSFITVGLNCAPNDFFEIEKKVKNKDIEGANTIQTRLTDVITAIGYEYHWINAFKAIFVHSTGINVGNPRLPLKSLTEKEKEKLFSFVKKFNLN